MKKDYNLSMIRFIAMFMVIFCHIFEEIGFAYKYSVNIGILGNFLAIGVQIFLMLSGYLYGKRENLFNNRPGGGYIEFILKNFKKILVDYYIYLILIIIPVYYFRNPKILTFDNVFALFTFSGMFHGVNHLWFIPYILFCYLLTPLLYELKKFLKNKAGKSDTKYIIYVILCMILLEIFGYAFRSYFAMNRINCYFIGFFLFPILKKKIKENNLILFLIECIILFISIICWYKFRYIINTFINN